MKRIKNISYAIAFLFAIALTSCGEDTAFQEILDNTELDAPSFGGTEPTHEPFPK